MHGSEEQGGPHAVWVPVSDPGCRLEEYSEATIRYAAELFVPVLHLKSVESAMAQGRGIESHLVGRWPDPNMIEYIERFLPEGFQAEGCTRGSGVERFLQLDWSKAATQAVSQNKTRSTYRDGTRYDVNLCSHVTVCVNGGTVIPPLQNTIYWFVRCCQPVRVLHYSTSVLRTPASPTRVPQSKRVLDRVAA